VVVGFLAMLASLPAPWFRSLIPFAVMVWSMLFFGGFVLPPLTGIMLNTVPEYHRGQANSLATLSYNLLGYFPAPAWYGFVAYLTGHKEDSPWPMVGLLYASILTFVFVMLGMRSILKK
jgi:sugar phosphate permease